MLHIPCSIRHQPIRKHIVHFTIPGILDIAIIQCPIQQRLSDRHRFDIISALRSAQINYIMRAKMFNRVEFKQQTSNPNPEHPLGTQNGQAFVILSAEMYPL